MLLSGMISNSLDFWQILRKISLSCLLMCGVKCISVSISSSHVSWICVCVLYGGWTQHKLGSHSIILQPFLELFKLTVRVKSERSDNSGLGVVVVHL